MKTSFIFIPAIMVLLLSYSEASYAQKATEIYIPIGESPGLSGQYSKIGTVSSVNESTDSFTVADSLENTHTVVITDTTRIWLDCTLIKERNVTGTLSDIKKGLVVEVKYYLAADSTYTEIADWVKVQITEHSEGSP